MPNPNLTTGQVLPGFYGYVDYNAQGTGRAPNLRALIWGYIGATAQRTPNQPFQPGSQQEVDDGCERGSDAARGYSAGIAQPEAQGAELWVMPISEPSGGVAAQYKLKVFVAATNPAKAGTLQLTVASQRVGAVGFTTSDTSATIATALNAALNVMKDLPLGTCTVSTDTVTVPYKHKGLTGEDLPMRCNISPNASGVTLSPGQLLFATNATGAGSIVVAFGALSVSTAIANADTAAAISTKVAASFNADSYPLFAAVDGGAPAQCNLFFANDKDVRRISASVVTSTGTTVNLGSGVTSGTGSPTSFSYNGTQGTGTPSLTAALTNLNSHKAGWRSWSTPWTDATSLGAMATNIENASNGSITGQKPQTLTFADPGVASVFGALLTSISPDLTAAAPHYAALWSPDVPVQAFEISARVAAARAALWIDQPGKNWNGFQIKGSDRSPILMPPTTPSPDAQNTALRTYALAPIVRGDSGNLEVVKGRTTSLSNDKRFWAWSTEAQAAYHWQDLQTFFKARFGGGSILRYSTPKAPGLFDKASFESATRERMRFWEANGNYDGADALAAAVKATPDVGNPFRMNVEYPESPVLDLDQVVFVGHFTTPGT